MKFTYNFDTYTLESEDPSIYVKVAGKAPDQGTFFALFMGEKKVGFASNWRATSDISEVLSDGSVIWRISEVGCALYARHSYIGGGIDEDIPPYRFEDEDEQEKVMSCILDAVGAFPGIPNTTRFEEHEKYAEEGRLPSVKFTEGVELKKKKRLYLKGVMKFRFDRSLNRIICDDENIYVIHAGSFKEEGEYFVLYYYGTEFGFSTSRWIYSESDETDYLSDGTIVWRFRHVGCPVRGAPTRGLDHAVLGRSFGTIEAQNKCMALFLEAMAAYSERFSKIPGEKYEYSEDQGISFAEYTPAVLDSASRGEFV